jgi:hypothetical protein
MNKDLFGRDKVEEAIDRLRGIHGMRSGETL